MIGDKLHTEAADCQVIRHLEMVGERCARIEAER